MKNNKHINVFALGDIHGSFKPIRDFYNYYNQSFHLAESENVLIILGDAGFNYFLNEKDNEIKEEIGKYPFTYFVIRGNHDQRPSICMQEHPDDWHIEQYWGNDVYVENNYPYIKYALDTVAIYEIECESLIAKTLVVPGAYSPDKETRLRRGWSYFEQEQLSQEEMDEGLKLIQANPSYEIVLSHTCPICFEPTELFLPENEQTSSDNTMESYLGHIEYEAHYKLWLWGHFHQYREYPRKITAPSFQDPRQIMLYCNKIINVEEALLNPQKLLGLSIE